MNAMNTQEWTAFTKDAMIFERDQAIAQGIPDKDMKGYLTTLSSDMKKHWIYNNNTRTLIAKGFTALLTTCASVDDHLKMVYGMTYRELCEPLRPNEDIEERKQHYKKLVEWMRTCNPANKHSLEVRVFTAFALLELIGQLN